MATGPDKAHKSRNGVGIVVAVLILALLAGGGLYFGYTRGTLRYLNNHEAKKPGPVYSPEVFIVNIAGTNGERYLKAGVSLEVSNKRVLNEVHRRGPQVRDVILNRLSRQTLAELQSEEGKEALRKAIARDVNEILEEGKVRAVYFTEFVLQ